MAKYAKLIDENDNVVTAVADFEAGDQVAVKFRGKENLYHCNQDLNFGHKMAISPIKKGEKVLKYGQPIGTASKDIAKGDWVHVHNVKDDYKVLGKDGKPLPGQE
jgi:altronate dehydratase small subunit